MSNRTVSPRVLTSSLHRLTIHESSNRMGNQPLIQTLSTSGMWPGALSAPESRWSLNIARCVAINWAHFLISLMASILV